MNTQQPSLQFWRLEAAAGLVRLFGEAELARLRKIRRLIDVLGVNAAGAEIILRRVDELAAVRRAAANGDQMGLPERRGGGSAILPLDNGV
ncbi:MAG: hypothetical protein NTZ05_22610 [Chloroflexi bacterium]|nr:hypothetical protein [Chloroflexota bacterium]